MAESDPIRRLERSRLAARRRSLLACGRPSKADLWTAEDDGGEVVVKEYRGRRGVLSWWGALQLSREARLLAVLRESGVAPRLVGRIENGGLVVRRAPGVPLFEILDPRRRELAVQALEETVGVVHALGVAHLDLRSRDNVLVAENGSVTLLDWASGMHLAPGGLSHRSLFPMLRGIDRSAIVKWKDLYAPESLDASDLRIKKRFLAIRALWPFNRKGLGEVDRRLPGHRTK